MLCPTCGQSTPPSALQVDLNTGWATAGEWKRHLSPMEAELLYTLLKRQPETVSIPHLISRLYGICEPPNPKMNLAASLKRLRRHLSGSGYEIRNTYAYGFAVKRS